MPRLFADLHCHPGFYSFNRMRNGPDESDPERFHPWRAMAINPKHLADGRRASSYAQSSVAQLAAGRCRLVFASFTPIEKGFFVDLSGEQRPFWRELLGLASGETVVRGGLAFLSEGTRSGLSRLLGLLRNPGPARQTVQRRVMGYSAERMRHFFGRDYDYWQELLAEYDFFKARDGIRSAGRIARRTDGGVVDEDVEGTYHLVRDSDHLAAIIDNDVADVALVLTIEGGYVFSIGPDGQRLDESVMFERIRALKNLDHPIFFVTLAHHFDNGLCGHAHSIVDSAALIMDQSPRMNAGFETDGQLGLRVVRELLDLDEDLRDRGGRRILIDAKHMSAQSRHEYYQQVIEPHLRAGGHSDARPAVPVLFSHAAHAGVPTLASLIEHAEDEDDHWHRPPFYAWNINLCDEDVRMVHRTGGLIGLCFDQRICGVPPRQKVPDAAWPDIVLRQIFGLVDAVLLDERLEPVDRRRIWDCICIGSDYDGFIDPLSRYPTAVELDDFASDLRAGLIAHRHTRQIDAIGVDELVEKIAWRNAYEFTRRHLPTTTV